MWRTIKYAIRILKDSPVLSTVSMLGTALAIAMVMVISIADEIPVANYYPAMHRDRMLYVKTGNAIRKDGDGGGSNSHMSDSYAKALKRLPSAELVTIYSYSSEGMQLSLHGSQERHKALPLRTDETFWQLYEFDFLRGGPYTAADVESGVPCLVLSQTMATKLFGQEDPTGKLVEVDFVPCQVRGVVRDVSCYQQDAWADMWLPLSLFRPTVWSEICGANHVAILARDQADFPKLRSEVEEAVARFNESLGEDEEYIADLRGQPDAQRAHTLRVWSNQRPDLAGDRLRFYITVALLLLIPAVNLGGIAHARMARRQMDLGIRRAFGATKGNIVQQLLVESTVQTLLGGLVGLLISYAATFALRDMLMGDTMVGLDLGAHNAYLPVSVMVSPLLFAQLLLFCLALNLAASIIPAWLAAKRGIVYSLSIKK